jgi:cytochrome c biogenesis protein CcdA
MDMRMSNMTMAILAIIAGVLVLVWPDLMRWIVGIFLIVWGLLTLLGKK